MKLNDEILSSLKRAIKHYGNTSQFAEHIGVAHSTVLFWLSGKTSNISGKVWTGKLRRELRPFMSDTSEANGSLIREEPFFLAGLDQHQASSCKEVCIAKFSEMLNYDFTVESPVSFVKTHSSGTTVFANEKLNSFFALELDVPEAGSFLPKGAKMLLSSQDYAQDGDIVVGKLRDPLSLFLCRYQRVGSLIRLIPLDHSKEPLEWLVSENAEKVFWMYPVEEIQIDLLRYRWDDDGLVPRIAQKD